MFWYVYSKIHEKEGEPRLGDGNCVALVQKLTNVGHTSTWSRALRVMDSVHLPVGCVIATFEFGRYANRPTGNHAASSRDMVQSVEVQESLSTSW